MVFCDGRYDQFPGGAWEDFNTLLPIKEDDFWQEDIKGTQPSKQDSNNSNIPVLESYGYSPFLAGFEVCQQMVLGSDKVGDHENQPGSSENPRSGTGEPGNGGGCMKSVPKRSKSGRGPKTKYVYSSAEQAAEARRQRNRETARASYYKRRHLIQQLEDDINSLETENKKLKVLFDGVQEGSIVLDLTSEEAIDKWLVE